MNWTKFKSRYLFSINMGLAASVALYLARRDFHFHWIPLAWILLGCFSFSFDQFQQRLLKKLGHINSIIILGVFYFLFFTPYSLIYRWFFLHSSFKKQQSTWIDSQDKTNFDVPF